MATGTRSSVRLEEQMALLIQRMDEQNLQVKSLTEHLCTRVESAEKGQQQMMSALREVESSLLDKQKELRESILQEVVGESILQEVVGDRGRSENEQQSRVPSSLTAVQKPIPFDGKVSWESYKTQFEMLSSMNHWGDAEKATYLAISLRGAAMGVLDNLPPDQRLDYNALSAALEIRFGTAHQVELSRMRLKSRSQRRDESLPELAEDIERLTRSAYPDAAANMIEVLAKDQFIDALQSEDMRLRVRQSRPSTLRQALEASLELESFELASRHRPRVVREAVLEDTDPENNQSEQKAMDQLVELVRRAMKEPQQAQKAEGQARQRRQRTVWCWKCGKKGHMQRECRQQPQSRQATPPDVSQSGNDQ